MPKYLELNESNDIILYTSFDDMVDSYSDTESIIETFVEEESCTLWELDEDKEVFSINASSLENIDLVTELLDELFGERKDPGEIEVLCESYDLEHDCEDGEGDCDEDDEDDYGYDDEDDDFMDDEEL